MRARARIATLGIILSVIAACSLELTIGENKDAGVFPEDAVTLGASHKEAAKELGKEQMAASDKVAGSEEPATEPETGEPKNLKKELGDVFTVLGNEAEDLKGKAEKGLKDLDKKSKDEDWSGQAKGFWDSYKHWAYIIGGILLFGLLLGILNMVGVLEIIVEGIFGLFAAIFKGIAGFIADMFEWVFDRFTSKKPKQQAAPPPAPPAPPNEPQTPNREFPRASRSTADLEAENSLNDSDD